MDKLTEGLDYYIRDDGRLVFTEQFLLKRGFCCGNGCLHCPFDYMNVPQPKRSILLAERDKRKNGE
jgi:hypothetical protein